MSDEQRAKLGTTTVLMVVMWGVFFSLNALGSCILAAMVNATWEDMGSSKRILMGIAIGTNWTAMMMAFFSKTVARMEAGKPPVPTDNGTDFYPRAGTQQFQ